MDIYGYRRIDVALIPVDGEVLPVPEDPEDIRFITITTPPDVPLHRTLNALADKGLMENDNVQREVGGPRPRLRLIDRQLGHLTLQDLNAGVDSVTARGQ